ncbi:Sensor protein evgS precursor [Sphingobacterium spiritivorum]|uniref:histidine kinase n=1 Tax=Sphingobacterium spiritivorum TaxID=258 RepID=A0A380BM86_SPHSI|nr:two-component regulator propeller domain-containing protein [Sphingobacterium spiritivorum]SUJ03585.1 Sensor protein evgS precursor [Sphingobacterium spiritivorum]
MTYKPKLVLYLFLLLLFLPAVLFAQYRFDHLSVADGLSNSTVLSIGQDRRGFMWFGTRDGLNRYDGRTVSHYSNTADDPTTLIDNDYIYSIKEDDTGNIWFGSQKGLSYYSLAEDRFEQINYQVAGKSRPHSFAILCIYITKDKRIFFGTNEGLSYLENNKSRKFIHIGDKEGLVGLQVNTICEDASGNIWVGTDKGLNKIQIGQNHKIAIEQAPLLQPSGSYFVRALACVDDQLYVGIDNKGIIRYDLGKGTLYKYTKENGKLSNNITRKIIYSKRSGKLYIGTMSGLTIEDLKNGRIDQIHKDLSNSSNLSDNSIKDIFEDKDGSIWLGTNFGGVSVFHPTKSYFKIYRANPYVNSLSGDLISQLKVDRFDNLWIGTEGNGLDYLDRKTQRFTSISGTYGQIRSSTVKSIWVDADRIWIGLFDGGIDVLGQNGNNIQSLSPGLHSLNQGYISSIQRHPDGKYWFGTASNGINIYDSTHQRFSYINDTSKVRLSNNYIKDILIDQSANVWVGTVKGLNVLWKNTAQFELYEIGEEGLTSSYIHCIRESPSKEIWIGTYKGGVYRFDKSTHKFERWSTQEGLPSPNIMSLEFDEQGMVWVATDKGLARLNPKTGNIQLFDTHDGLPSSEFSLNASTRAHDGRLYFGTYKGLVEINPRQFSGQTKDPEIRLSALKLFNTIVHPHDATHLLDQDISLMPGLTLNYDQNYFTIDFISIDYINQFKIKYRYKLDGFDQEWNNVDQPVASYTNLSPGNYTLLLNATNADGKWGDKPYALTIKVRPPLWQTWWAYVLYALILLSGGYLFDRFRRRQIQLSNELLYQQKYAKDLDGLYQAKLDFFTKISHEIRTPLTLIVAPLDKLLEQLREKETGSYYLSIIKKNVDRLLLMVNELLDFRKIEEGKVELKLQQVLLLPFIQEQVELFQEAFHTGEIRFTMKCTVTEPVYLDPYQFSKVMSNLLVNAIKFTPAGGSISIVAERQQNQVAVVIADTGMGIAEEDLGKVFANFYQSDQVREKGWGIGLSLCKAIVEQHGGTIRVQSTAQKGTAFTILLPASLPDSGAVNPENTIFRHDNTEVSAPFAEQTLIHPKLKRSLLIVEDNRDVADFLLKSLELEYDVYTAANGEEGVQMALEILPQLIISDVSMPKMDGVELTRILKSDPATSHIPVILLTAMDKEVQITAGYLAKANAYIIKPFSIQVLLLQISNQLDHVDRLREKYTESLLNPSSEETYTDLDAVFLKELKSHIENRLEDADLRVTDLIAHMGVSQTAFYKKVKALTGLTIGDFIKILRLNRAAALLQETDLPVSQIAYKVGFNDPKYFSKEFKKYFGKNPTDYSKK